MHPSIFFANSGIFGISEWARGAIAKAGGGVGVFAELFLVLVGSLGFCDCGFVGAELMVDYLPDHFVVLHGGKLGRAVREGVCAVCGCFVWVGYRSGYEFDGSVL